MLDRLTATGIVALVCVTSCLSMENVTDLLRGVNQTQFVAILEQAIDQGLVDLSSGGPYTILVPTDDAFSRLLPEERANLTSDATTLSDVIKFHIILGEQFSWSLSPGRQLHTLNDHTIRVYTNRQGIYLNDGHVLKTDLEANNAVIHIIDTVLDVPEGTIYDAINDPQYPLSTFASYIGMVHLNRTLNSTSSRNKYTVFAPSNDAFANLSSVILNRINSSPHYLRELINYHIHKGVLHLRSLDHNSTISTLDSGHVITITVDTDIHLNHVAQLEQAGINCDNGVVNIIDHVLIPTSLGGLIG